MKETKSVFARIMILISIIPLTVFFITSWITDTLFIEGEDLGFFEDIVSIIMTILLGVIVCLSYLFFEKYRRLYQKMWKLINFKRTHLFNLDRSGEQILSQENRSVLQNDFKKHEYPLSDDGKIEKMPGGHWEIPCPGLGRYEFEYDGHKFNVYRTLTHTDYVSYIKANCILINGCSKHAWKKYAVYGLGFVFICWYVLGYHCLYITFPTDVWRFCSYPLNFLVSTSYYLIVLPFVFLVLLWRFVSCAYLIFRFSNDLQYYVNIIPLHQDGVGGLRPLGEITLSFHYVLLSPIAILIVSVFGNGITQANSFNGSIYFTILILLFFAPLISTHDVMDRHRKNELEKISGRYNALVQRLESSMRYKVDPVQVRILIMEEMDKTSKYFREIERIPVWPFDMKILSSFFTSMAIPVILMAIQFFISR